MFYELSSERKSHPQPSKPPVSVATWASQYCQRGQTSQSPCAGRVWCSMPSWNRQSRTLQYPTLVFIKRTILFSFSSIFDKFSQPLLVIVLIFPFSPDIFWKGWFDDNIFKIYFNLHDWLTLFIKQWFLAISIQVCLSFSVNFRVFYEFDYSSLQKEDQSNETFLCLLRSLSFIFLTKCFSLSL